MFIQQKKYQITVNYVKKLEEMIHDAKFDYINSSINSKNFPIDGKGIKKFTLQVIHFESNINTDNVIAFIHNKNKVLARIEHLISLATEYPYLQQSGFPIIALGSVWERTSKEHVVPVLRGNDNPPDRNMHLLRTENKWNSNEYICIII